MTIAPDPTLQAITEAAVDATGASHGWLLPLEADSVRAVAVAGPDAGAQIGNEVDLFAGGAGYVVASGQPLALQPRVGDAQPWAAEHALLGRTPSSIVAAPCEADGTVVGVLELVDKPDGPFTFDDVEIVTLLSGIAGAALINGPSRVTDLPDPGELSRELSRLAQDDISAYARVAKVLGALLAHG